MTITIVATAIVLGVLIFVHELGHFMTAKWVDIEVPRFSIGFGPKVLGFRRGETEYVLSLLPLGGYVKMAGMEELETIEGGGSRPDDGSPAGVRRAAPRPRDFEAKSLPARTLVISAGVIMNLLFAVGAFTFIGLVWGVPATPPPIVGGVSEDLLPPGALTLATLEQGSEIVRIGDDSVPNFQALRGALSLARPGPLTLTLADGQQFTFEVPENDSLHTNLVFAIEPVARMPARVAAVTDDSPAEQAGLEAADQIVAAAGVPIESWQELTAQIEARPGQPVPLRVLRGGDTLSITVVPEVNTLSNGFEFGRIGIAAEPLATSAFNERVGPIRAVAFGFSETALWIRLTLDFLGGLFTGEQSPRDLGGPIAIAQISTQAAIAGVDALLTFMAILSVNLAILNLLPIPVLDGGQLLFLGIEAVRGRALSIEQRMRWAQVGFIIVVLIMVFAIGNDVLRWIGV